MKVKVIILFVIFFVSPAFSWAESKTFPRDYTYQAGEADSKVSSRSVAMEQVKRLLLEEIGTYIESHTEVKNFELTKDQITALTAGIVKLKIVDEKWDGEKYWLKAEIVVDPDDVTKKIDTLRQDREKVQELEDAKKRVEELLKENDFLRKNASKTDQASVKRYQTNVKSLEVAEMGREAQVFVNAGNLKTALEIMNEAVGMEPKNHRAYGMRGYIYRKMGKNGEAIKDLNKAIELKPDLARAYFERGFVYSIVGEKVKAIQDYSKAIKLQPKASAGAYSNRGNCYMGLRQYEEALSDYNEAISLNPKFVPAYINRGRCYLNQKKYDEALDDFNKAIFLDPDNASIYFNRASVYNKMGRQGQERSDLKKASNLGHEGAKSIINKKGRESNIAGASLASQPEIPLIKTNNAILFGNRIEMTGMAAPPEALAVKNREKAAIIAALIDAIRNGAAEICTWRSFITDFESGKKWKAYEERQREGKLTKRDVEKKKRDDEAFFEKVKIIKSFPGTVKCVGDTDDQRLTDSGESSLTYNAPGYEIASKSTVRDFIREKDTNILDDRRGMVIVVNEFVLKNHDDVKYFDRLFALIKNAGFKERIKYLSDGTIDMTLTYIWSAGAPLDP